MPSFIPDRLSIKLQMHCGGCNSISLAAVPLRPPTGDGIIKLDYNTLIGDPAYRCEKCQHEFRFGDDENPDVWSCFNELKKDIRELEEAIREVRLQSQATIATYDLNRNSIVSIEQKISDISSDLCALELQMECL